MRSSRGCAGDSGKGSPGAAGAAENGSGWFAEKWEIPAEAYLASMERCRQQKTGVPQWYVLVGENGEICAGAGLIENDFHSRKDLVPMSVRCLWKNRTGTGGWPDICWI